MRELVTEGLNGYDLLMAWVTRQVIPLQRWLHNMCFLSGRIGFRVNVMSSL